MTTNDRTEETEGTPGPTDRRGRRILRYILAAIGGLLIILSSLTLWIYVDMFSGPALMEISEFHPYRSPESKEEYLRYNAIRSEDWPVPVETKWVTTSYGTTFVRVNGPVHGPPVILIPGAAGTSLLWRDHVENLSQAHRTFAIDNIYDYGLSIFTRQFTRPDDFTSWMDELFTALGLQEDINIVGMSYGGWLAAEYTLRHPDRIGKCILISPAATVVPFNEAFFEYAISSILPPRYFTERTVLWLFEDLANRDAEGWSMVQEYVDESLLLRRCFKFRMLVDPRVLSDTDLRQISAQTFFMIGEREKIYRPEDALRRLASVAPSIKTKTFPNAGHDLVLIETDRLDSLITDFLRTEPRPTNE